MDKMLTEKLLALSDEVESTAISADCKQRAAWCFGKLPSLYASYQATNESRFGDEITRLVQAVMKELSRSEVGCKEAQRIATGMISRFQLLHEELGLQPLGLKALPSPAPARAARKR